MDLDNGEGSYGTGFHLVRIVGEYKDFVSDVVVLVSTAAVFIQVILVGESLAAMLDLLEIDNCRYVEQHVSTKYKCSRGQTKGFVDRSSDSTLSTGDGSIGNFECHGSIVGSVGSLKGSNLVSNCQVSTFDDSVGLRVLDSNRYSKDSIASEG